MKVLFVCNANVHRSQMAAALYNRLTKTHQADSAGIIVDTPGETLGQRKQRLGGSHIVDLMKAAGIDVSHNKRTLLTPDMLQNYDKIISMADESLAPSWLVANPKYEYWDVPDPIGKDMAAAKRTRETIEAKLRDLM